MTLFREVLCHRELLDASCPGVGTWGKRGGGHAQGDPRWGDAEWSPLLFSASWCIGAALLFSFPAWPRRDRRFIAGDTGLLVTAASVGLGGSCAGGVQVFGERGGCPSWRQTDRNPLIRERAAPLRAPTRHLSAQESGEKTPEREIAACQATSWRGSCCSKAPKRRLAGTPVPSSPHFGAEVGAAFPIPAGLRSRRDV